MVTNEKLIIWQCPDCKRQLSETGISHECIATGDLSYNFESIEVIPMKQWAEFVEYNWNPLLLELEKIAMIGGGNDWKEIVHALNTRIEELENYDT